MDIYKLVYTGVNIIGLVGLMIANFSPVWVLLLVNVSLFLGQIVDFDYLIKSFANEGILTVLLIFPTILPFVRSVEVTNYIHTIMSFGSTHHLAIICKITIPVFIVSAFVPNTPIVVALYPFVDRWCKSQKIPSSKYLIPLSYATILGGTLTIIGTSTNLLSQGIVKKWGINWNISAPTQYAILPGVISLGVLIALSDKLLPNNDNLVDEPKETRYKCRIMIPTDSPLISKNCHDTLSSSIDRFELYRNHDRIALTREAIIEGGDIYIIYSPPNDIINFLEKFKGEIVTRSLSHFNLPQLVNRLTDLNESAPDIHPDTVPLFYKVVPSNRCTNGNMKININEFESTYHCIVVAVSDLTTRSEDLKLEVELEGGEVEVEGEGEGEGELEGELEGEGEGGSQDLEKGEESEAVDALLSDEVECNTSLLVYSTCHFLKKNANSQQFVSITRYRGIQLLNNDFDQPVFIHHRVTTSFHIKQWHIATLLFVVSVCINISGLIDLLPLTVISLLVLSSMRILDIKTIIENCNWEVYFMLILSSNIGYGLTQSKLDVQISNLFKDFHQFSTFVILLTVGFLTIVLTAFTSNSACVAIMLPITYQICLKLSLDPSPFLIYVTTLASVDFMTPFGYQTNLIIQPIGQYKCIDYLKLGSIITVFHYLILTSITYVIVA